MREKKKRNNNETQENKENGWVELLKKTDAVFE
jgi:hypothetical protein